jgi:hypothetical protein
MLGGPLTTLSSSFTGLLALAGMEVKADPGSTFGVRDGSLAEMVFTSLPRLDLMTIGIFYSPAFVGEPAQTGSVSKRLDEFSLFYVGGCF